MLRITILCVIALLLAGCSSMPSHLELPKGASLITYDDVVATPEQHQGKLTRWGGIIADVQNTNAGTWFEVLYYPLTSSGRPSVGPRSRGRFKAYFNSFMDPMEFEVGRAITFTGRIKASESGKVGEADYRFPVLAAKDFQLWKDRSVVDVTTIHFGGYWGHHWYGWHGSAMFPVYRRTVVHYDKSPGFNNQSRSSKSKATPAPKRSRPAPTSSAVRSAKEHRKER